MDTNFLAPPVLSPNGGTIRAGFAFMFTSSTAEPGTRTYYTLNGADPRAAGGAVSSLARLASDQTPIVLTSNAQVMARNWNPAHSNLTGPNDPPLSSPWSGLTTASF
jgi:hypothetical protein